MNTGGTLYAGTSGGVYRSKDEGASWQVSSAGLESPIVFLMGVHALFEEEQSVRLAEQEQAESMRDNTRKLYLAFTRADQRMVITCSGETPAELANALAACHQMAHEPVQVDPGRTQ